MMTAEQVEASALRMVANGQGGWPIRADHALYGYCDEVFISFSIEDITNVDVFVRRDKQTIMHFRYEFRRVETT